MNLDFNSLTENESREIIATLRLRFEQNLSRHKGLDWTEIEIKILAQPDKLVSLLKMELTGGEPDVVGKDEATGEIIFMDCSAESPKERRSICYDRKAWEARKENKPNNTAEDMAAAIGIQILNEQQYRQLQNLGNFDTKTSSWIETPIEIRKLGGALFGDRRYNTVFFYHNGADSYYAARGFRGILKV